MDNVTDPPDPPIQDLVPPAAEHLSYEQILVAVDALSDQDRARLELLERRHLDGTDFAEGDLLHEAVCSAILEGKKCPCTTPFIAFLALSMRNIAGRQRKKLRRQVPISGGAALDKADDEFELEDGTPRAEEQIIRAEDEKRAAEAWSVLLPLYATDEQISLVLLAWEESMRGKELRDFVGVTQERLDYIIKKIRRIAAKQYPKGWQL
jgi:DNA-directed RNA polymerase specialized sigma24 family protein